MLRGIRNGANLLRDAKAIGSAMGTAYYAGQALYDRYKRKRSGATSSAVTVREGRKLGAAVKRQAKMLDNAVKRARRLNRASRIGKGKRNKRLKRTIQSELEKGKSIGKYKKVVVEHKYRNYGGNVTNSQGVHEFYHFRPKELLDAVSVLFNGKTASTDWSLATNNFAGDPDFSISGRIAIYIQNIGSVDQKFDVYHVTPKQDSDTTFYARWDAALDEVGGTTITPRQWDIKTSDGSRELARYWNGTKKKRTVVVKPGATVLIDTHTLPKTGVNWEDMKYQGSVITFKKGITSGTILVQQNPLLYTYEDGHRVGAPPAYQCGFVVKTNFSYRCLCPDQADVDKNQDNFVYLNNMNTSQTVSNAKMPSKPVVENIATTLLEQ